MTPHLPPERTPHVAIMLPTAEGGGAERSLIRLAKGLHDSGVRVDLVFGSSQGEYRDEVDDDLTVIDLKSRRLSTALPGLVRYLRSERPTSALTTLPHGNVALYFARRFARTSTRVYLREASTLSRVTIPPLDISSRAASLLLRSAYMGADGVVAVSHGVAQDLHEHLRIPREKIHIIPNPVVDEDLLRLAQEPPDSIVETKAPHMILAVGRLIRDKGFDTLVRAFALVRGRLDASLVILGEGPERGALEALVDELGLTDHVHLPGFVPNPFAFMARADVFVLSSRREGLPGVLIQAMACGCPVVSTDCMSGPSEILENGRLGELVPVDDEALMAQAIVRAHEEPPDVEPLKLRARAYSLEASVQAYRRLLL